MKNILKLEELVLFFLGIYLFSLTEYVWWWFVILLFIPDISMIGYICNNKLGALLYNIGHHKGIAVLIYFTGIYFNSSPAELTGIILFTHSSMDRALGYGLKYEKGFAYTHLGIIGKKSDA